MNVSIIIPTYNRCLSLEKAVFSFMMQSYAPDAFEIIVADNNSRDRTAQLVPEMAKRSKVRIRYIFEPRQGVHFARNSAAKMANGDYLYYTDDDMEADPDMIGNLFQVMSEHKYVGCATGRVLPKWSQEPPIWVKKHFLGGWLSLQERPEDLIIAPYDVGVWSCHQMIRKDVFFQTNGFHPENTDGRWVGDGESGLNKRIYELGYKFAFVGNSITYHGIPKERMTQVYFNRRMANQGNSDSFTEYREHRPNNHWLLRGIVAYLRKLVASYLAALKTYVIKNDRWHWHLARCHYWLARIKYDTSLMHDATLRSLVTQKTYME